MSNFLDKVKADFPGLVDNETPVNGADLVDYMTEACKEFSSPMEGKLAESLETIRVDIDKFVSILNDPELSESAFTMVSDMRINNLLLVLYDAFQQSDYRKVNNDLMEARYNLPVNTCNSRQYILDHACYARLNDTEYMVTIGRALTELVSYEGLRLKIETAYLTDEYILLDVNKNILSKPE